jgi:hypothetical protein
MILLFAFIAALDYNLDYDCSVAYDNHLWEYSTRDLEDFIHGIRPDRFPIETYDDLVTRHNIALVFRTRTIMNRTTTVNFRAAAYSHWVNREKDRQSLEAGLRQSLGKYAVKLEYLHIPRDLIKYYPDPASGKYVQCSFTEHRLGFKTSFLPSERCGLHLRADREWDNYVPAFSVYDIRAWRWGVECALKLSDFYEPTIAYEFKGAQARGPVPDLSYLQHSASIQNLFYLRFPRLARLNLGYEFFYRTYTVDLPPDQDTPHNGRIDATHRLAGAFSMPLIGFLGFTVAYEYEFRRASSPNYPEIGTLKDYDKYLVSAGMKFHY